MPQRGSKRPRPQPGSRGFRTSAIRRRTRPDRGAAAARPRTPAATGVRRRALLPGRGGCPWRGRAPRYRPRASRPRCRRTSCRGCSPCARRRTRRVAKQLGRRALMLAAVPFADPLIERPAPADRAREGIESYLEPDRIGHDPGEGDRCLLASASTPEPAAPHQSTRRGRRSNPASPPRTPPGAAGGFRSSKNPTRQA
jgi:hypothetical protein